jgi:hypothetical protein
MVALLTVDVGRSYAAHWNFQQYATHLVPHNLKVSTQSIWQGVCRHLKERRRESSVQDVGTTTPVCPGGGYIIYTVY